MKNEIIEHLSQLVKEYDGKLPDEKLKYQLKQLVSHLDDLGQGASLIESKKIFSTAKSMDNLVSELLNKYKNEKEGHYIYQLKSGFEQLDKITNGFGKGEVIVIGGRPGMGTTSFMIQLVSNIVEDNKSVLFYSFDLPDEQLLTKLIACKTKIPGNKINQFKLSDKEHVKLFEAADDIAKLPIFIVGNPEINVYDFIERCRLDLLKIKPEIIFIDSLQLIGNMGKHYDRDEELSLLMRELKVIARSFNIPIVISSQVSRDAEMRGGSKKPILSDLRSSGSIEEEADKVIFVYRPEYYGFGDNEGNSALGLMELIVAKNNSGFLASAFLKYDLYFTHFTDFEENIPISKSDWGLED